MAGNQLSSSGLSSCWIIDIGANGQMVGKHLVMHNSGPIFIPTTGLVKMPNVNTTNSTKLGSVKLNNAINLHNALHVPSFDSNLLSVFKFTKDDNCFVTFYPQFCLFQDLSNE